MAAGLQAAETDVIAEEEDACTVTAVVPDITGS
jgi:hypothetical protein